MSDFQITSRELPHEVVAIFLAGDLDSMTSSQLEEVFEKLYNQGIYKYIVDLSGLSYISSRGVAVFLKFLERVREYKGNIILIQPNPEVKDMLSILGVLQFIEISPDQTTALKFLGQ